MNEPPGQTPSQSLRTWNGRAILHMDLDAFFAAVEQLDNPALRGKPVIVGGDPAKRGVVSTCSYEARAFGVRSAMPSARAVQLCPNAVWVHGNFARYREMSSLVFAILRDESPLVQPVSIDEAFLDVTPGRFASEHPVKIAERIRCRVSELGLTASVGVATSKTVAKIASDHDKPDGLTVVWPDEEIAFLSPLPVRDLSGIGVRTAERLASIGVRTLGDLSALDRVTAEQILGAHAGELIARASGRDERAVHENPPVKQVSHERTFASDIREQSEVETVTRDLAAKVGRRLRAKGLAGRTVGVKLRFSDFTTATLRHTMPRVTDDERTIVPIALDLISQSWTPGIGIRLLGVGVSGFGDPGEQLDLFERSGAQEGSDDGLMRSIDLIKERFGSDALRRGL